MDRLSELQISFFGELRQFGRYIDIRCVVQGIHTVLIHIQVNPADSRTLKHEIKLSSKEKKLFSPREGGGGGVMGDSIQHTCNVHIRFIYLLFSEAIL